MTIGQRCVWVSFVRKDFVTLEFSIVGEEGVWLLVGWVGVEVERRFLTQSSQRTLRRRKKMEKKRQHDGLRHEGAG